MITVIGVKKRISKCFVGVGLTFICAGAFASGDVSEVDPWEGYNRKMFQFNDSLDRYVLKPVAQGYKAVTPEPVEKSVANFFSNLSEVRNILNNALQWKLAQMGNDTGRFLVNSTIGIAGLFDVAKTIGLKPGHGEDFGQTLAVWGVKSGPFVVLPLFGPSNLRDASAFPVDSYTQLTTYIDHVPTRNSVRGTGLVAGRAGLLEKEKLIKGDRYTLFRDAYLQRRKYLVNDGVVEDNFDSFLEDEEY